MRLAFPCNHREPVLWGTVFDTDTQVSSSSIGEWLRIRKDLLPVTTALYQRWSGLWLQLGEPLEAEVTVKKISGRRISFETVCRRCSDQAVVVDGAALARMPSNDLQTNDKVV